MQVQQNSGKIYLVDYCEFIETKSYLLNALGYGNISMTSKQKDKD